VNPRSFSLRTQQLLTLLLAGSIPLALLLVVGGHVIETRAQTQAFERMRSTLSLARQQVEEHSIRQMEEIRAVSSPRLLSRENKRTTEETLDQIREVYDLFNRGDSLFALLDLDGMPLGASRRDHVQFGYTSAFRTAADGTPAATPAHFEMSSRQLVSGLYHPVYNEEDTIQNVVRHYVPIDVLAPNMEVEGTVIWLSDTGDILDGGNLPLLDSIQGHVFGLDPTKNQGYCHTPDSNRSLYVKTSVQDTGILDGSQLLYLLPEREALASLHSFRSLAVMAGLVSFALLTLISFFASARLARPIQAAAVAAGKVAQGNLDTTLEMEGPKELQQLSGAINTMSSEVAKRREFLEEQVEERTRSLIDMTAFSRAINNGLDEALVVFNADATALRFVNQAARDWFKLTADNSVEAWQEELKLWFDEDSNWEAFWDKLATSDRTGGKQFPVRRDNRDVLDISSAPVHGADGSIIGRLWLFRDVSQQERLQSELRQTQKVEAVGRLAGGLAHDFNNILAAIQGGLELLQMDLEQGRDPSESIDLSLTGCNRAAGVVQQLLSFSRQRPLELKTIRLRDIVQDTVKLIRPSIDRLIKLNIQIPNEPIAFAGDRVQVEQVLMNLLINASHAMPDGGEIRIRCFSKTTEEENPGEAGSYAGEFSCIEVTDNGHGMTEDVKNKMFDPFFTTKPQGQGTGLGLATSLGIVQRHKGWITCKTAPGQGTTFTIALPAATVGQTEIGLDKAIPIHAAISGRILLVDDEAPIRKIARIILKRSTHQIEEAVDGIEALEWLEKERFDLVVLDLTMPRLSGAETLSQIKQRWPALPVLIWSGHSEDAPNLFENKQAAPDGFLVKPFRGNELTQAVGNILRDAKLGKRPNVTRDQA